MSLTVAVASAGVFMIHRRSVLAGLTLTSLAAPAYAWSRFRPLFNRRDLDGWTSVGDANWSVADGVLSADKGGMSFLVSRESFRDFDLRAELWVSDDAVCIADGVVVYNPAAIHLGSHCVVSQDADLAEACGADGVHLPERASAEGARHRERRQDWILTAAAHSQAAA
eukprot:gene39548-53475_t